MAKFTIESPDNVTALDMVHDTQFPLDFTAKTDIGRKVAGICSVVRSMNGHVDKTLAVLAAAAAEMSKDDVKAEGYKNLTEFLASRSVTVRAYNAAKTAWELLYSRAIPPAEGELPTRIFMLSQSEISNETLYEYRVFGSELFDKFIFAGLISPKGETVTRKNIRVLQAECKRTGKDEFAANFGAAIDVALESGKISAADSPDAIFSAVWDTYKGLVVIPADESADEVGDKEAIGAGDNKVTVWHKLTDKGVFTLCGYEKPDIPAPYKLAAVAEDGVEFYAAGTGGTKDLYKVMVIRPAFIHVPPEYKAAAIEAIMMDTARDTKMKTALVTRYAAMSDVEVYKELNPL